MTPCGAARSKRKDVGKREQAWRFPLLAALVALLLSTGALQAQTFTVLYNLGAAAGDPSSPTNPGIIAQGRNGDLYGVTPDGCGAFSGFGTGFSTFWTRPAQSTPVASTALPDFHGWRDPAEL